jgi:hypothetical protein
MRNVLVITGTQPIHFSNREAQAWVDTKDALWEGRAHKRIRLTKAGLARFRDSKLTIKIRGFSAVVGEAIACSKEPWARTFASHQFLKRETSPQDSENEGKGVSQCS